MIKTILKYTSLFILGIFLIVASIVFITHLLGLHEHGNYRKSFTQEIVFLPSNTKLKQVAFDKNELWILIQDIKPEEKPEEYILYNPGTILSRKIKIFEFAIR